jgi:hypothetical protein
VNDQWIPGPPSKPPTWTVNPLPPSNAWDQTEGCAAESGPAIVEGITITGVPATVSSLYWQVSLNDGSSPPNFQINALDGAGNFVSTAAEISPTTISLDYPVLLSRDPVEPMEAVTLEYLQAHAEFPEAPMDNYSYARYMATWERLPQSYIPEAPNTSQRYGRFNSIWQLDAIQTDAAADGAAYGRLNNAWTPVIPTTGGTITGSLTVNQVMTVQGPNSLVLNAPLNNPRAILAQAAGITRWLLNLGDQTNEGLNNVGANFSLQAYSTTGVSLGTWLSIARADGSTIFNGSGVTIQGGLAVNGLLAVSSLGNFYLPGGTAGQVLSTNGSGVLSWATRLADAPSDGQFYTRQNAAWAVAPGGMTDAPSDGTAYARKSAAWAHLTHTDITDWTATLAPYALTTAVPVASSTLPLPSGVAAVGTSTTYARADHVHPSDAYSHDNRIINGDMRIDQHNAGANTVPVSGAYVIDRWAAGLTQAGKFNAQRITANVGGNAPAIGYNYFLALTSLSAYVVASTDQFTIRQPIEADMISDFAWGTAGAQPVTLSFWALCNSLTGTFGGAITDAVSPTRSYPFTYQIPTANLWTKIVISIPGDVGGTWTLQGNGVGACVHFSLGVGSGLSGPPGAWASGAYRSANGAQSIVGTNGAQLSIMGVKLEVGSAATPFNHPTMAKALADCQRYYQVGYAGWYGYGAASGNIGYAPAFGTAMRAGPTIVFFSTGYSNASAIVSTSITAFGFQCNATSGTAGAAAYTTSWTASAEL